MLEKGKIYEAVICDYTAEGQGIAKIDGCAVFIPNAIFGEKVCVRIEKAQKTWASGRSRKFWKNPPTGCSGRAPFLPAAEAVTSGTWIMKRKPV